MTIVRKKFDKGVRLKPSSTSGDREGELWVDSNDNKLKIFLDDTIQEFTTTNSNTAAGISFNNLNTGLTATNVQDAIDEIKVIIDNIVAGPDPAVITSMEFVNLSTTAVVGVALNPFDIILKDQYGAEYIPTGTEDFFGVGGDVDGSIFTDIISGPTGDWTGSNKETINTSTGTYSFNDFNFTESGSYVIRTKIIDSSFQTVVLIESSTITVVSLAPAVATTLITTQQPTNVEVDTDISPPITVEFRDQYGLLFPSTGLITVETLGTGNLSSVNDPTLIISAIGGVATFSDLQIDTAESGVKLNFTSGTLVDTSTAFNVTDALKILAITEQPTAAIINTPITPPVIIQLKDQFGVDIGGSDTVTASIFPFGILTGTTSVNAIAGEAIFTNLRVNSVGEYSILFSSPGFNFISSDNFDNTPVVGSMAIVQQPTDTLINVGVQPPITVQLKDQFGVDIEVSGTTIVLDATNSINTGTVGTSVLTDINGLATFNSLTMPVAGNYTIEFTSPPLALITSVVFDNNVTEPVSISMAQNPVGTYTVNTNINATWVTIRDIGNGIVDTSTVTVTATLTSGGSLTGDTVIDAIDGTATFTNLQVDTAGVHTITYSSPGLTPEISGSFTIIN
jgi:hypothetical protein